MRRTSTGKITPAAERSPEFRFGGVALSGKPGVGGWNGSRGVERVPWLGNLEMDTIFFVGFRRK